MEDVKLSESLQGDNCKFYKGSEITKSRLGDKIVVGNDSIVQNSILESNISINRRNFIHRVKMGCFTYTGINTSLRSCEIGKFCSISWGVSIGGGDHPNDRITTSTLSRFYMLDARGWSNVTDKTLEDTYKIQKKCIIENDVLISTNAIILREVKIGNGAIIGAGAVVTKDVEPYSIVAGVPAKKIKMRFNPEIIKALEEIKWWDWPIAVIRQNLDIIYSSKVDEEVLTQLRKISNTLK
jgi:acetyltransferase-like isoleucine patch superfamily enzyme